MMLCFVERNYEVDQRVHFEDGVRCCIGSEALDYTQRPPGDPPSQSLHTDHMVHVKFDSRTTICTCLLRPMLNQNGT